MELINREKVDLKDTWDLSGLFETIEDWQSELGRLEADVDSLYGLAPDFTESAVNFEKTIRTFLEISEKIERLYCYTALLSDQDTANSQNFGYKNQAFSLYTKFSAASSFLSPAIIALDDATLDIYLTDDNKDLHRSIREIARFKPHTLSDSEEKLLAEAGEVFSSSQMIFSQLTNADLKFEPVEVDGVKQPLTQGSFVTFLKDQNRSVRELSLIHISEPTRPY